MVAKNTPHKEEVTIPKTKKVLEEITVPERIMENPPELVIDSPSYFVYIGPSLRALIAKNAIIGKDNLDTIKTALERYPDINHLLIPGDQLGAARAQIRDPDSFLAQVYGRLAIKA